jgi:hypothetical protein
MRPALALLAVALLTLVCLASAEAGCGCDEGACANDCPTACCVASSAPFVTASETHPPPAAAPAERTLESPPILRSVDPRGILHVPKAARS